MKRLKAQRLTETEIVVATEAVVFSMKNLNMEIMQVIIHAKIALMEGQETNTSIKKNQNTNVVELWMNKQNISAQ